MEVDAMNPMNLEQLLLKVIGSIPASEFMKACAKEGLSEDEVKLIFDAVFESGE
jgi:hypothetical protein